MRKLIVIINEDTSSARVSIKVDHTYKAQKRATRALPDCDVGGYIYLFSPRTCDNMRRKKKKAVT